MNRIILQLTEYHHRFSELLYLLAQEITVLASGDEFESRLTLGILDYIKYQPDLFHHPLEELIFDRLRHHSELLPVIDELQDDHSTLAGQTKECRTIFIRWTQEGELWDRTRASDLAKNYIDFQRRHMALEERELFPFAVDALTEADWNEIGEFPIATARSSDPLFGPTVIERYRNIRDDIQKALG